MCAARASSFRRSRAARGFQAFKIRLDTASTSKRFVHATAARSVALANSLFRRHHAIFSMHIRAAGHVKCLASIHYRHKPLRQSPGGLTHLCTRLWHEAILHLAKSTKAASAPVAARLTSNPRETLLSFDLISKPAAQPRVEAQRAG